MKIIVTGGCGFVGSNIAIFLKKKFKNSKIISVDNLSRKGSFLNVKRLIRLGIKNYKIDISKKNSLKKFKNIDYFIDSCADPAIENSKKNINEIINNNFLTTVNILNKVVECNSRIIFLSSSRVYSIKKLNKIINKNIINSPIKINKTISENFNTKDIKSIYGLSKLYSEELIKEFSYLYNTKYIINRCGVISGPWQFGKQEQGVFSYFMKNHILKKSIKFIGYGGNGHQIRDVLHINDLNELILKQIKNFNKKSNLVLNVGGGIRNKISILELKNICQKITKNKCNIKKIRKTSNYDIPYFVCNNNKVNKIYNWKPKKNVEKIMKDIYLWQIENKKILRKF